MYNYTNFWQNMQQCNLNSSQFYRLQSQNVNCAQRINDGCTNVAFNLQQQRIEDTRERYKDFPKSCYNCKHKRYGYRNVTDGPCDRFGGISSYDYARSCIINGYTFWELDIPDFEVVHADENGVTFKSKDEDRGRVCDLIMNSYKKSFCLEDAPKPEKKYTVYDMYDLVFPDDPIKAHFDAERKRINEEYEKQKAVVDKLEVPEVVKIQDDLIFTETYEDDIMTVPQEVAFWIGAIALVVILILT